MHPTAVGPWTRRILVANVVAQVGIVVTGGLVRLTGSGLGCPTWPQCAPGSYTPVVEQAEGIHAYVEFGNRLLTFVVGVAALAAMVAVLRHRPRRPGLSLLAGLPLAGVLGQVVLGGVTVLTRLHPATVAAHFLLSMVLIAVSVLLLVRACGPDGSNSPGCSTHGCSTHGAELRLVVRTEVRWLGIALAVVAGVVLVLGTVVTGSGPHSGDAQEPARFALDPRTVSWLHADAVLLFVGLVVAMTLALRLTGAPALPRRRTSQLLAVTLAQGGVGYLQYFTGLPEALVAVHMLGACLLVVAVTALLTSFRAAAPVSATAAREHRASPCTLNEHRDALCSPGVSVIPPNDSGRRLPNLAPATGVRRGPTRSRRTGASGT